MRANKLKLQKKVFARCVQQIWLESHQIDNIFFPLKSFLSSIITCQEMTFTYLFTKPYSEYHNVACISLCVLIVNALKVSVLHT